MTEIKTFIFFFLISGAVKMTFSCESLLQKQKSVAPVFPPGDMAAVFRAEIVRGKT